MDSAAQLINLILDIFNKPLPPDLLQHQKTFWTTGHICSMQAALRNFSCGEYKTRAEDAAAQGAQCVALDAAAVGRLRPGAQGD